MRGKKKCLDCGERKSPKGLYCKKCGYSHRKRPTGLKYNLKVVNKTWFTKGHISWNKGIKGIIKLNIIKCQKGKHHSKETEFKKGQMVGEKNFNWKGDNVGYFALHSWVKKNLGKARKCEKCGEIKNIHWANSSGKYLRNVFDWEKLCSKCHGKKDSGGNRGFSVAKFPELRRRYEVLCNRRDGIHR